MNTKGGAARSRGATLPAHARRRILRRKFDTLVREEWNRYRGKAWRILARTLRERFLQQYLKGVGGTVLELGPGPGRFTPIVGRRPRKRVVGVDLSREGLRSARRRARRAATTVPVDWIQGAGEHLPLGTGTVDAVVVLGNVISFAAGDGPKLLKELARVLRPRGVLIADFQPTGGAILDALYSWARKGRLPEFLRHARHYQVDDALATGFLPYAPGRGVRWEFQFYTVPEAKTLLTRAGFRVADVMSVAPLAAYQDRIASIARRDPRAWHALLRIEERVGRRPGAHEVGHGFVVAATRR